MIFSKSLSPLLLLTSSLLAGWLRPVLMDFQEKFLLIIHSWPLSGITEKKMLKKMNIYFDENVGWSQFEEKKGPPERFLGV